MRFFSFFLFVSLASVATARAKPVIYSGGLWNNLFKWQEFSNEMANTGREGWMIEVTGGPNEECDTCKDYTYDDLVDDYWPASVAAALAYSERDGVLKYNPSLDKADYVGFSNGCRVALDSLKEHGSGYSNNWKIENETKSLIVDTSLPASPIDTFVGVACPGAFEGDSVAKTLIKFSGEDSLKNLRSKGKTHVTLPEIVKSGLLGEKNMISDNNNSKISLKLWEQYINWVESSVDSQPASSLFLNKFALIEGQIVGYPFGNDGVVTLSDQQAIYSNVNSNNKRRVGIAGTSHLGLTNNEWTKSFIRKTLNNESLTNYERNYFLLSGQ